MGDLYAAQTGCVGFHSSLGDGACADLPGLKSCPEALENPTTVNETQSPPLSLAYYIV